MATSPNSFYQAGKTYTREEFDALLRDLAAREGIARRDLSGLRPDAVTTPGGETAGNAALMTDGTSQYTPVYVDARGNEVDPFIDGPEGRVRRNDVTLAGYRTELGRKSEGGSFKLDPSTFDARESQDFGLLAMYNPDGTLRDIAPGERTGQSVWNAMRPAVAMAAMAGAGGWLNAARGAGAAGAAGTTGAGTAGAGLAEGTIMSPALTGATGAGAATSGAGAALAEGTILGATPATAAAGGAAAAGGGATVTGGGALAGLASLEGLREAAPLISAGIGAATAGATSTGASSGSGEASRRAMELGDEVFDWYKANYADTIKPLQQRQADTALATADQAQRIASTQEARGNEAFDRYRSTFQPVENALVDSAMQFDQRGFQDRAAALASAGIQSQFNQAEQQLNRDLARAGVQQSSGQAIATRRALALSRAANMGAAANQARTDADATGFARKQVVAELGRDVARDSAGHAALALTGGQSAIAGGNAALSGATQAAGTMGQGFGQALSAFNAGGNQAANQSAMDLRADSQRNELIGTLAGAAGQYFAGRKKAA